jgi:hypothetical protein
LHETGLLAELPGRGLQGIMLRPDPAPDTFLLAARATAGQQGTAENDLVQRLATALDLSAEGLTYKGRPGRRIAFGCSAGLRNTLAPDRSSITFSSKADLTGHWVMVLQFDLRRDWTWDGLDDTGFEIARTIGSNRVVVGFLTLSRAVSALAVRSDGDVDRTGTRLVFFDAIDPKPAIGAFPAEIEATYEITPRFRQAPAISDPVWKKEIRAPIAARPTQTPSLVSAGIALSPYEHDEGYTLTQRRQRVLWLEFAEPVLNEADAYFGRVLAHSVDPMLTRIPPEQPPVPDERSLALDPELIRVITPGQSKDDPGRGALGDPLVQSASATKFYLPLPSWLSDADPELFGFFVYEFVVANAKGWCLAQALPGPPLRVTGIQHPAPPLVCQAMRTPAQIVVNAPFAVPVSNGKSYWTDPPLTQIWALLYAQVTQVDGTQRRNVLLGRARQYRGSAAARQKRVPVWLRHLGPGGDSGAVGSAWLTAGNGTECPGRGTAPRIFYDFQGSLGSDLGEVRILRTSTLTPVPAVCVDG